MQKDSLCSRGLKLKTVYKYKIRVRNDIETIRVPKGSQLRKVAEKPSEHAIYAWVEVETEEKEAENLRILVAGTGFRIANPSELEYIDSIVDLESYVWHFYRMLT
jgi:hypothetical protein